MKALKQNASVIGIVIVVIAAFTCVAVGVFSMLAWDKLRGLFGHGPFARRKVDKVKVYAAVPGLVMDEDGFVLPPEEREAARPRPVLVAVPSLHSVTSMTDRRQSYHDAAPSVHSPGDASFAQSIIAFPESPAEREELRRQRLARQIEDRLPANVVRISDFRSQPSKR